MINNRQSFLLLLFLCTLLVVPAARTPVEAAVQAPSQTTGDKTLLIIQFSGPPRDTWIEAVQATGTEVVQYAGNDGYLVWAGGTEREQLDQLASESDFLRAVVPLSRSQKMDRQLRQAPPTNDAGEEILVTIQMLRHDGRLQTEKRLDALVVKKLSSWEPVLNYQNLQAVVPKSAIDEITQLPDVVWIGEYQAPELLDERQGQIVAGNLDISQKIPSGPGYLNWLVGHGFSDDPEKYPIIDFTDDGIGNGIATDAAGDTTFRVAGDPDQASRLVYLNNCTTAFDASGPNGHGHINASIAGGYDARAGQPYQDTFDYQRGLGINPFGRLAGTRVFNGSLFEVGGCGSSYQSIVRQSYQSGARIINNSWGCTSGDCTTYYTQAAQIYDAAVRDADELTPGNQEILIVFSAGNEGRPQTIGAPANAKNVLTVGASENVQPSWTDNCGVGPSEADNLQDIWIRSSRGPAPGGRVKPDLVAPGTHVTGTASTALFYNGSNICNNYYPPYQQLFTASSGTSHSAPAVSAFASLAHYWLAEKAGIENPSPALLKAYLVANSRYLSGNGAGNDLPSFSQGYGLANLEHAFDERPRIIFDQEDVPLLDESGQSWSMTAQAADSSLPVRIVMAFTDAPGNVINDLEDPYFPRVNDLDLVVKTAGEIYLGNEMAGQWSQPGGEADPVNTIEAVFLPPGEAGALEIQVTGTLIAGDGVPGEGDITDQDFVLVCDNCKTAGPGNQYQLFFPVLIP